MSYVFLSRFSVTILIIVVVCNTCWASTVIAFDNFGSSPVYPKGGEFGKQTIDLGGLEVHEALYFKKIWATQSGGPNGLGASFYEPTDIPIPGHNVLGHYCKLNSVNMHVSVLTAKDTTGDPTHAALKSPIDYTLIWTSKGENSTQDEEGYIWFPVAPEGYKAVGHIVTTSPKKPSLDKVSCVRSDFTDLTEVDTWIWGSSIVNVYTTKPLNSLLSVPVGTFWAQNESSRHELPCLKTLNNGHYPAMPNSFQISTIIQSYAPLVYFHPDEQYFPSTVLWFFEHGVELHQNGKAPELVVNDGDNLPNTGGVDDAYLDLPQGQSEQDNIKKGFLSDAIAYIHVKEALGGTHSDFVIWLYYPFNGGGKFQLGPFTINLGIIGEHVSDWEHITLRIDNYRGILKEIYLSQHAKGKWYSLSDFELVNGTRPVVYAALHGHAHYATPSHHIHSAASKLSSSDMRMLDYEFQMMNNTKRSQFVIGEKFWGFGVRDDAAKSNNMMDIASSYKVVGNDDKDYGSDPWLNYTGRWGPKIVYNLTEEILKIADSLPHRVRKLAIKVLSKFPPELLGEEAPQGPKMHQCWSGDERV